MSITNRRVTFPTKSSRREAEPRLRGFPCRRSQKEVRFPHRSTAFALLPFAPSPLRPPRSHPRRHGPVFRPILAPHELVGLVITNDPLCFRVKLERPADATSDVSQMRERSRKVPLFHVRVGPFAAPHAVEKVLVMSGQIERAG